MAWRVAVVVLAALHAGWGFFALAAPVRAADLVGIVPLTNAALGEVRVVFGGLFVALGYLLFLARDRADGAAWLRAIGWVYVGLAAARAAGLVLDGWAAYTGAALAAEAAVACVLHGAASRMPRARP